MEKVGVDFMKDMHSRALNAFSSKNVSYDDRLKWAEWILEPCDTLSLYPGLLRCVLESVDADYKECLEDGLRDIVSVYQFRLMIATKVAARLPLVAERNYLLCKIFEGNAKCYSNIISSEDIFTICDEIIGLDNAPEYPYREIIVS